MLTTQSCCIWLRRVFGSAVSTSLLYVCNPAWLVLMPDQLDYRCWSTQTTVQHRLATFVETNYLSDFAADCLMSTPALFGLLLMAGQCLLPTSTVIEAAIPHLWHSCHYFFALVTASS